LEKMSGSAEAGSGLARETNNNRFPKPMLTVKFERPARELRFIRLPREPSEMSRILTFLAWVVSTFGSYKLPLASASGRKCSKVWALAEYQKNNVPFGFSPNWAKAKRNRSR
jgi:hypothetical protein